MIGSWNVDVTVGKLPQKVATAVGKLNESIVGTEYTPIAYLGSQVVNGINHAVLAEQVIVTGKDTKNVVILIFNEKPNEDLTLTSIERVVESGSELGGTKVDVQVNMSEDVKKIFDENRCYILGYKMDPFALLATQPVNGVNYIYIAEVDPNLPKSTKNVALVVINPIAKRVKVIELLESKEDFDSLGYAFTWLGK